MSSTTPAKQLLTVYVKTRSKNRSIKWIDNNTLKISVIAPPEKGRANKEVVEALAKELKTNKSSIEIVRGKTTTIKQVVIH